MAGLFGFDPLFWSHSEMRFSTESYSRVEPCSSNESYKYLAGVRILLSRNNFRTRSRFGNTDGRIVM
ncbi:hypothetical protein C8E05_4682 [Rhodococcus wratislaviensis]|nr:hypothetical protein C8E05_4682 [Rhodococcus wratislaviensis]